MKKILPFIIVPAVLIGFAVQKYWLDKTFGIAEGSDYHWHPYITLGIIAEYLILLFIANKYCK